MTTDITPTTILNGIEHPGLFLMSAADLNDDGLTDFVFNGGSLPSDEPIAAGPMIFTNQGQGSFSQLGLGDDLHGLIHPREFGFADFNGDGDLDVLIVGHGHDTDPFPGESNTLLLSDGNGGFLDASGNLPSDADFSHSMAIADIDGDGNQDIYIGNVYGENIIPPYLLLGDGSGGFERRDLDQDLFNAHDMPSTTAIFSDLDGDETPELILGAYSGTQSRILSYDADAKDFTLSQTLPDSLYGPHTVSHDVKTADLNNDGLLDIVIAQAVFEGQQQSGLQILLQEQDGSFSDQTETFMQGVEIGSEWIQFFEFMDVNDDGLADIITDRSSVHGPNAFINTGGHFIPVTADVSIWNAVEFTTLLDPGTETVLGVKTYDGTMEIAEIPLSFYGANVSVLNETGITRVGTDDEDTINGGAARDDLNGGFGDDHVTGSLGSDTLRGDKGRDMLIGGKQDDILYGNRGGDRLLGGADQDRLYGNHGLDILRGGSGNDTLDGGVGRDKLFGGIGSDTFVFGANSGKDVIKDFVAGTDVVQITSGANSFDDLTFEDRGEHTKVLFGDSSILFRFSEMDAIMDADNFIF